MIVTSHRCRILYSVQASDFCINCLYYSCSRFSISYVIVIQFGASFLDCASSTHTKNILLIDCDLF